MIKEDGKNVCEGTDIDYDEAFSLSVDTMDKALASSPSIIRRLTEHLMTSRGKFIRAAAVLTCALNKNDLIHENAVKFASAIEILHLATLVHDDVIDDADTRRGISTLQKRFGKGKAVICGDYLLCIAMKLAHDVHNKQDYLDMNMPDYMTRVCLGELYEQLNSGNMNLSVLQYLRIISGKTAALFEASFYAGAVLSGCDREDYIKYKKMGRYLGMIFQLIDDCMDFEATESVAKKPVLSDFENNVVTLPLIHAFSKNKGLKESAERREANRKDIYDAVSITGGISFTRMIAKKYYNKYIKTLESLDMTDYKRNGLMSVLNKAYRVF